MATYNIRQLEDRARDVDPDLRYMALEDLQTNLNDPNIQVRNVSSFVPLLFDLLSDNTTEVQNQAVKSFPPLVRHVSDAEILQIVQKLYQLATQTSSTSKFTTSVPNLALRSIFNATHARFGRQLARDTVDILLPQLFASQLISTIDNIEILIDLVKNLGAALNTQELSTMITSLVTGAYKESGIISKRSIMAIDCVLEYVSLTVVSQKEHIQFYDKVFADIDGNNTKKQDNVTLSLYQVALAHVRKSRDSVLSEQSTDAIFRFIQNKLDLQGISSSADAEDLDIDVLVAQNLVREDALITLLSLVSCISYDAFSVHYASSVVAIISQVIIYDPFSALALDYPSDEESEVDFSDDEEEIEQFDDNGENDGLAAKLRLRAVLLLKSLILCFPQFLLIIYDENLAALLIKAIGDRSDLVSNEAISSSVLLVSQSVELAKQNRSQSSSDVSMTTEGNKGRTPFAKLCDGYTSELEVQIFENVLTSKNIGRFFSTKALVECVISGLSLALSDTFLSTLHKKLVEFKLTLKVYPDQIKLYKVILSKYELDEIPRPLLKFIQSDVIKSLNDLTTYHTIIGEVLSVCRLLFGKLAGHPEFTQELNEQFFPSFAGKINSKQLSSDARQNLLATLTSFVVNIETSPENLNLAIEVFQESLNYEVTVNFTIDDLITVCNRKPQLFASQDLCNSIVGKLNAYLGSSDASLYLSSLVLLDSIFEKTNYQGNSEELSNLLKNIFDLIQHSSDSTLLNKGLRILGHSLKFVPVEGAYFENLIIKIVNPQLADVDDVNLSAIEYLVSQLSSLGISCEELFSIGMSNLILKNFISAKILALITLKGNLNTKIEEAQNELLVFAQNGNSAQPNDRIIFDIHFLGCVASEGSPTKVTFDDFFSILNSDANEELCLAAARAMGLYTTKNLDSYLPTIVDCYRKSTQEERRKGNLILVAIKQVLASDIVQEQLGSFDYVWNSIIEVIGSKRSPLSHSDVAEWRLAGVILSRIAELSDEYHTTILQLLDEDPQNCNQNMVYVVVVIIKQLLSSTRDEFDNAMIVKMLKFLPILNLELKQGIVSTLLTGIYNKSVTISEIINDEILPRIYDELTAKEEFKKVIPMGPYKYVIDEGLEVRKLSFELISAIMSVDTDKLNDESCVNKTQLFEALLVKGLKDSESDIVNLTILNLLQLIQDDQSILTKITNQDELIASLTKVINKKLRSKASTQELESYENTLRSAIKLSKAIDRALTNSNSVSSEWSNYYHEVKNKHHLLFSAGEL